MDNREPRIERITYPQAAPTRRITVWDHYTVIELRQLATERSVKIRSRDAKDDIVAALVAAGVTAVPKPPQRYRGKR